MNASTQQKSKQIEEIIAEANKVFQRFRQSPYELTDTEKADASDAPPRGAQGLRADASSGFA